MTDENKGTADTRKREKVAFGLKTGCCTTSVCKPSQGGPSPKRPTQKTVVDSVIDFWPKRLPCSDILLFVYYNALLTISTQYSGFMNVMTYTTSLEVHEKACGGK